MFKSVSNHKDFRAISAPIFKSCMLLALFILASSFSALADHNERSISGHVFEDTNSDGVRNTGEHGLKNFEVNLISPDGSMKTGITNDDGYYQFDRLQTGTYQVRVGTSDNHKATPTTSEKAILELTDDNRTTNFAFKLILQNTQNNRLSEVQFPDPNLEAAIRAAINKLEGNIYTTDLQGLKTLVARVKDIRDITGLEHCCNLEYLFLESNQITDISSLSGLTNLETLVIYGNQITDISPLVRLTNLKEVALWNNQITDLSPLSGLANVTILSLSENQISDISPLLGLTNLESLFLANNLITNISPLLGLTNLKILDLSGNQITNFLPLSGLTNLTDLSLSNLTTDVSLVSFFMQFPKLNYINFTAEADAIEYSGIDEIGSNHIEPTLQDKTAYYEYVKDLVPIASRPYSQTNPSISEDKIVWTDNRTGYFNVYLFNITTSHEKIITNNRNNHSCADVCNNKIIWTEKINGFLQIFLYDLTTGLTQQVTQEPIDHFYSMIEDNNIIWVDKSTGVDQIYLYEIDLNNKHQISKTQSTKLSPVMTDNRIVWVDDRNGNWDIYLYDISLNQEMPICVDQSRQANPWIDGDVIVWADGRNKNWDIYSYNLETEIELPLETDPANQGYPFILGKHVAWLGSDAQYGDNDIVLYDLEKKKKDLIPKLPMNQAPNDGKGDPMRTKPYASSKILSVDKVVFMDYTSVVPQIMMIDIHGEIGIPERISPASLQSSSDKEIFDTSNQPPKAESLTPDKIGPQETKSTITWSTLASDPDKDTIYYKFLLKGARTGDKWDIVQDWSTRDTWTWNVEERDVGSSEISVLIKDGKHPSSSGFDDFKNSSSYRIIVPQLKDINVQVANDLYTDADRTVYYCQEGKYQYYQNRLYLTGPDLDKVKSVTYVLPQSFPQPEQVSDDASNNFEIWILTWGRFNQIATITTKSGQSFDKPYQISFKDKVEEARQRGIPVVQKCDG